MADIKYLVTVDAQGAIKSIKDFDGAIDNLGKQSDKTGPKFGGLWKQIAGGMTVYGLVKKAGHEFVDFLKDSVNASMEAEDAERNLEAALQTTGRTIEPLKRHFMDYSSVLQRQTKYGDEAIQGAQALLLQLTKLDKDGIDAATRGAIGLASAFKTDLQSASNLVAKALAGNYGALSRYGITVTETLSPQEKQRELLEKLGVLFGRAQAETGTFSGKLAQLKNIYGDIQEIVGTVITKNRTYIETLGAITRAIERLKESGQLEKWIAAVNRILETHLSGIKQWALLLEIEAQKAEQAKRVYQGLGIAIKFLGDRFSGAAPALKAFGIDFSQIIGWFKGAPEKINEVGTVTNEITEKIRTLRTEALKIINAGNPLAEKLQDIQDKQIKLNEAFKNGAINAVQYHAGMAKLKRELIDGPFSENIKQLANAIDDLSDKAKDVDKSLGGLVRGGLGKLIDGIKKTGSKVEDFGAEWGLTITGMGFTYDKFFNNYKTKTEQLKIIMDQGGIAASASWAAHVSHWASKHQEVMDKILGATGSVVGQIDQILQQSTNNKLIRLDKEYQAQLENIKKSKMSEEEKQAAIMALEDEYSMKRQELQRKAATQGKAVALAQAIINVAEGVTKALSALPPPFNIALAAITAAAGAIQVAMIRAQSIPLAQGAIFKKPALLTSQRGQQYEVAEAGEAEIVSSPRRLREAIMGGRGRGGDYSMSRPIIVHHHHHLILDGREMKEFITQAVMEFDQLGRMKLRKALA